MPDKMNRRQSDQIREGIDGLIVSATSIETKEILNLFRNMDDKLKDIAKTLHEHNQKYSDNYLKISNVLNRLEERIDTHEREHAETNGKHDAWRKIINGMSGAALMFCAWAGTQYFELRDSKLITESRLAQAEKSLTLTQKDVLDLKDVVNNLRIDSVQKQVIDLKKKHLNITKLSVIRNSR